MTTQPDKFEGAREQAQAQFESIREMVEVLNTAQEAYNGVEGGEASQDYDEAQQRIHEDALSVEVRTDWHAPGDFSPRDDGRMLSPSEYRILLCTGGPAVQITGQLNEHCEPETARLEMQDWFTPWTEYRPELKKSAGWMLREQAGEEPQSAEEILLTYARQFYFGE